MTEPTPTPSSTPGPGRRAGVPTRRIDLLVGLAVALPAVVAVAVMLIGDEQNTLAGPQAPTVSPLTSATVVCPSGTGPRSTVTLGRVPGVAGGDVDASSTPLIDPGDRAGDAAGPSQLVEGQSVEVVDAPAAVAGSSGATVLQARGGAAPGLVAGRGDALAVGECRAPSYDEWLVSVGASARYATVVELVNPDDGEAVVDLAIHGGSGMVEEPALRGLQVPPHSVRRVDLSQVAPRGGTFTAHLTVVRGRVSATAINRIDSLGRGRVTADYLPAVAEPSEDGVILGLPQQRTGALLTLANPGDDEVRVTTRLVTEDAVFTPTGAPEITLAPQGSRSVSLQRLLSQEKAQGVVGVQLVASAPIVSSLRLQSAGDIVLLAPVPDFRDPTAVVLPTGDKTLVLGRALRTGVVHVVSHGADGTVLADERVEVGPGRASRLALPAAGVLVTVEPRNTSVGGVVTLPRSGSAPGLATLRLLPANLSARIPVVAPQ
ncbi:DUF5719 family protein [Nocardioides caeni]|uniref:Secreted protein n=1 Tax=Nocardioides caeni TaxID=574700 RepID=A0A4S8NLJ8_9ACTN|nr:DUF5719 family protein [Nocardioides caeni]THV17863.1 hypothetical protein E9934_05220 [Nocardioides caeni]